MSVVAAAAATATCPGGFWGHPEGVPAGVSPSPPRHFTFEAPPAPSAPSRPRRRHRRVLYPPAVRRPLPAEEPSAAKRLLVLLLAVVGTQIYNAPGDVGTAEGAGTPAGTPPVTPGTPAGTPPVTPGTPAVPEAPPVPAGTAATSNGTTTMTTTAATPEVAPMGGSCASSSVSPPLSPPGGVRSC